MELSHAIENLRKLAKGRDPISGEPLPKESLYNHPEIVRTFFALLDYLPKQRKGREERQQENLVKGLPRNTGLPWSDEVRQAVAGAFQRGESIDVLAGEHERSRTAIIAELKRQGLVSLAEAEELGLIIPARGQQAGKRASINT